MEAEMSHRTFPLPAFIHVFISQQIHFPRHSSRCMPPFPTSRRVALVISGPCPPSWLFSGQCTCISQLPFKLTQQQQGHKTPNPQHTLWSTGNEAGGVHWPHLTAD